MSIKERDYINIEREIKHARRSKFTLDWEPKDIATDMLSTAKHLVVDLEKYLNQDLEASAKRVRTKSKILETLGKSFRVQSVKSNRSKNNHGSNYFF
jgi:hypothetical protein